MVAKENREIHSKNINYACNDFDKLLQDQMVKLRKGIVSQFQ